MNRPTHVAFANLRLERAFEQLAKGDNSDRALHTAIQAVIDTLKEDPLRGIRIPQRLWPDIYRREHGITNLWKKDLPDGRRLIYTIKTDEVMILSVILEWFDHQGYERRFGY